MFKKTTREYECQELQTSIVNVYLHVLLLVYRLKIIYRNSFS